MGTIVQTGGQKPSEKKPSIHVTFCKLLHNFQVAHSPHKTWQTVSYWLHKNSSGRVSEIIRSPVSTEVHQCDPVRRKKTSFKARSPHVIHIFFCGFCGHIEQHQGRGSGRTTGRQHWPINSAHNADYFETKSCISRTNMNRVHCTLSSHPCLKLKYKQNS